ncbi:GspE/PulE family protein [Orenia marismortui]|uniref:GspE/PulE family protein n=1 Tax=Orenia marismortui TaxID=46469 RepID=UPI00035C7486|nr:ATPase, T2SS/T4P/T4SS family [Orenia marismortui]
MGLKKKRLGDILLDEKLITEEDLQEALIEQQNSNKRLGQVLKELGLTTEDEIAVALHHQLGVLLLAENDKQNIKEEMFELLDEEDIREKRVFPIRKEGRILILAMENPQNIVVIDEIEDQTSLEVIPRIATPTEIDNLIETYLGERGIEEFIENIEQMEFEQVAEEDDDFDQQQLEEQLEDTPIIKTVNKIIATGIQYKASDIHIEPLDKGTQVRYRIDGVLHREMTFSQNIHMALVSRIKVMSGLDIAERRKAQDGRINVEFAQTKADLRISILPASLGEKVVIRIFDKSNLRLDFNYIGFSNENLKTFKRLIKKPNGMILLTGPTGSGKTTTLYTALNYLNEETKNILTIEDPVEYKIAGITQTPVNPKKEMTFANALRVFVRQDPDIIMVGEIRDKETAETAIKSALTGHLVLSTLHTNSAVGAISRLINMGVEPFLIADSVIGVVAQRLLRKLCDECKETTIIDEYETLREYLDEDFTAYQAEGCEFCKDIGYKGRTAIHEILEVTPSIKEAIATRKSSSEITKLANAEGMNTLFKDGFEKVKNGVTTIDEIMRVANIE